MFVLGVTGEICSGKTTFCKNFKRTAVIPGIDTSQIPIINTDEIWDELLRDTKRSDVHLLLISEFGTNIYGEDNLISNEKLLKIIFSAFRPLDESVKDLEKLYEIIWPEIVSAVKSKLSFYEKIDMPLVILDSAKLFECGLNKVCDSIITIQEDTFERLRRLNERINGTKEIDLNTDLKSVRRILDAYEKIYNKEEIAKANIEDIVLVKTYGVGEDKGQYPSINSICKMLNFFRS